MAKLKRIGDILPSEMREQEAQAVVDWLNVPLIFHGYRELKGENGEYMRITVSTEEDGEVFILACGAAQVMDVMRYLKSNREFPAMGTLTKVGRAIILT